MHFTLEKTWGELIENDQSHFLPRLWYPGRAFDSAPHYKLLYIDAAAGTVKCAQKDGVDEIFQISLPPNEFSNTLVDGTYTSGMGSHFFR